MDILHNRRKPVPAKHRLGQLFNVDRTVSASVSVLMLAGVLSYSTVAAQTVVVPRVPVSAPKTTTVTTIAPNLPSGNPNSGNTNLASGSTGANPIYAPTVLSGQVTYKVTSPTTATINETSSSGILSWNSFNIGQGSTVNVVQPSSTSILLNRISGSSSVTDIEGSLKANGIVYLYNPNGIVFGKNSVVDVNSFVASTLNIADNVFLQGLLTPSLLPNFAADPTLAAAPGSIVADGQLNAANDGKIMLFAPNVTNNGVVTAPNGQVIMAAGGKVYLSAPTSTAMRGLYVEVDSSNLPTGTSSTVTNNGAISVGYGNATLAGLAVNQNGSVTASTSVNLNGSIYLQATGGVQKTGTTAPAYATTAGALTLGAGSVTQINIVDDGTTATQGPTDNAFKPSQITLTGQNITVGNNAQIIAHGGNVTIDATINPSAEPSGVDGSSVLLGAGSLINVSGTTSAVMPMSSNVISVQLLSELADNIVLRNSTIRGQTVNFDIRQGTTIADISADLAKVPYTVEQLAATGGTVKIDASGSITQQAGSKIDVSGGVVNYTAGYVNTSFLASGGALFSDSDASMDRTYSAVVNLPNGRWDYEPAYTDGKSAGSIELSAPGMVLQGQFVGKVTPGVYQRNVQASNRPLGGQLILGTDPGTFNSSTAAFSFGNADALVLNNNSTMPATLVNNQIDLNVDTLAADGFSRIAAYTTGNITVAGNLNLAAGGNLNLYSFGDITFNGGVQMPGGSVNARAEGTVNVSAGTSFNLAGTWVNDTAAANPTRDVNGMPTGDIVINGGDLKFDADKVVLNQNVTIDTSGGAWLSDKRKLTDGTGGNITLNADNTFDVGDPSPLLEIGADLNMMSYGLAEGGTLSLQTNNIQIGGVPPSSPDVHEIRSKASAASGSTPDPADEILWLPGSYFSQGGFSSISLNALTELDVNPGARINAVAENWVFNNYHNWQLQASGAMSSIAVPGELNLVGPMSGRKPVNLTFNADRIGVSGVNNSGTVNIGYNSIITTDPNGTVTVKAGGNIYVDGTIDAPGGAISLALDADPTTSAITYDPTHSIWLGPEAHLLAQGSTALLYTGPSGTTTGAVLGGGNISLSGEGGFVIVQAQSALGSTGGATIDVSGVASAPVILTDMRDRGAPAAVASAGGSVSVSSDVGILFSGALRGSAGNSTQTGATLSFSLEPLSDAPTYPTEASALNLIDAATDNFIPSGWNSGQAITGFDNQAWINTGSFSAGGFDRLSFKTANAIVLSSASGNFDLSANSSIYLDAPVLQVETSANAAKPLTNVQINSAYVQLGSDNYLDQNAPTANVLANPNNNYFSSAAFDQNNVASTGAATLNVNATTIDLIGNTVVQGVHSTNLTAAQDIRLIGMSQIDLTQAPSATTALIAQELMPTGEFSVAGNLTLTSAQVYPTTLSSFALNAEGAASSLNFVSNGTKGYAPLSAAGTLYGFAQTINQGGVVEAPFGTIDMVASSQLTYEKGSTTSVAGSGVIPFGMVVNGRNWVYDFGAGNDVEIGLTTGVDGLMPEITLPSKLIISSAPNVSTASGATLNLSGGGSLYAYEFTAGSYGTVDVLANNVAGSQTQVFAILPGYSNAVAPRDYQYGQDGGLQEGQSIYLSGIAGLPAGNYVLLPAHYALLPGGMAITVTNSGRDMIAANNVVNLDGSLTVAGRANVAGNGDSRTWGVTVTPAAVVREESQYQEYSLSSYFSAVAAADGIAVPQLPSDGGHLEFDASSTLALAGQFLLDPASGGRAGIVDISAPVIDVVGDASQVVAGNALKLVASDLNAIGADSLLLGGIRQTSDGVTDVSVGAQSVTIANTSGTALTGTEIILAAQNNVTLQTGAAVEASGKLAYSPTSLVIQNTDPNGNVVGTDGALLRASAGNAVTVQRSSPAGTSGVLTIGQGAVVAANGSAYLDATQNSVDNGQLQLGSGAALGIGASRISMGSAIPSNVGGLQFNTTALGNLSDLSSLILSSYSTIDLYGTVNLGSSSMQSLTLQSSGFQGNYSGGASGNVTFTAQNVQLNGGSSFAAAGPVNSGSAGTFDVIANNITVGNGAISINGYASANLLASNHIIGSGTGSLTAQNALNLNALGVNAATGSDVAFAAGGALNLIQASGTATASTVQMGGTLQFSGNTIASNADINAQAGTISMIAANGLSINGGTLNAAGASETFGSTVSYAPGGDIKLTGGNGNVYVASGAALNVSALGASAGTLSVSAVGATSTVTMDGELKGGATAGVSGTTPVQGSFVMDVGQLASAGQIDQLGVLLRQDGFTDAQSFRVRSGDINLDAGSTLTANNVTLSADNGNLNIGGTINASGAAGGSIALYASQATMGSGLGNVNLLSGSVLNAQATSAATSTTQSTAGSVGTGGSVVISTASADGQLPSSLTGGSTIQFGTGAIINVSGNSGETNGDANGTVTFRAPQLSGGNDVAIVGLSGTISGSKLTEVEGYKVYVASQISAAPDAVNADGSYSNLQAASSTGGVPTTGVMYTDAVAFANGSAASALAARSNPNLLLSVLPGIEVRSTSDLSVSVNETSTSPQDRGWNLDAWHINGLPVNLTLRAAGNLLIDGSISDGFVQPTGTGTTARLGMPDWALDSQISANFTLVGGADFTSANPLAVLANSSSGNVEVNFARTSTTATDTPVALVRTGTGSIDIAAGGNVVLGTLVNNANPALTLGAAIYTDGMQSGYDGSLGTFTAPKNLLNASYGASSTTKTAAQFSEDGGAISIFANGDVIGAADEQTVNNWLFHQGGVTTDANGNTIFNTIGGFATNTAWWSRPDYFDQGIATMAGGNVSIVAGGYLQDVSASVASSAFMPGSAPGALVQRGGGNLTVKAGGNIAGGSFYDQIGQGNISADGSIVAGSVQIAGTNLDTMLALGDAQLTVTARGDVNIATAYNPTMVPQSEYNSGFGIQFSNITRLPQYGEYSTYSNASSVTLTSVSGNVQLSDNLVSDGMLSQLGAGAIPINALATNQGDGINLLYDFFPANVNVAALNGSITSTNGFSMAGAPTGELNLLAANSINLSGTPVTMLDVAQSDFSPYYAPAILSLNDTTGTFGLLEGYGEASGGVAHTPTSAGLHAGDTDPVHIVALNGSIIGDSTLDFTVNLPKFAQIIAGQNIQDFGFSIQNNSATDVTTITAGNNFVDSNIINSLGSPVQHVIDGPGRIDISAGHTFDLGDSAGIDARGNLDNPYAPYGSAAINIQAGATTSDYATFVKNYVTMANLSQADQTALIAYVGSVEPGAASSPSAAWSAFQSLPGASQNAFLNSIKPDLNALFFSDLVTSSSVKGLTKFDGIIASLFPSTNPAGGDINVFASALKTEQGGSIYLFTPAGSVYAGLPNMPSFLDKSPSDEGVYTISGGAIAAEVHTNFQVDQGRVFSLGGGDITLVSQYGDLSAGNGTKSASSAPPPIINTNSEGVTVVDISGSIAGSGIATLQDGPDVPASSVYVIAPRGVFDAGDAGVRSSGSVEVNALIVLNAGNIVASGSVTGVPSVESVNIGAGLSSSATPNVADVAKNIANVNNNGNTDTNLSVDVLGYGADGSDSGNGNATTAAPDKVKDDSHKSTKH